MLASVGWQEICTHFHRRHPETCALCRESDAHVEAHINNCPNGYLTYPCLNGLWDIAMPIFIENRHFATFFTGQLFYDDTPLTANFSAPRQPGTVSTRRNTWQPWIRYRS
ncbi:hypothetical protein A6070_13885 [Syntrophotalea acetylenica]|nr:hypothetical protein A6070_13885 [Syntrophotalea acetylenica]